jgi:trimethylamine:corrinoid methyltransferase-like protein
MWRNTLRKLEVLSEEEVELVHRHAMTILEVIGIDFPRAGRQSGLGRVGGRFALEQMTDLKTVVVHTED